MDYKLEVEVVPKGITGGNRPIRTMSVHLFSLNVLVSRLV